MNFKFQKLKFWKRSKRSDLAITEMPSDYMDNFCAFLIDFSIVITIFIWIRTSLILDSKDFSGGLFLISVVVFLLIMIVYQFLSLFLFYNTVGRKIFGLKVVDFATGDKIGFSQAFKRSFSYVFFFTIFLKRAFGRSGQSWPDWYAETKIISSKKRKIYGYAIMTIALVISLITLFFSYLDIKNAKDVLETIRTQEIKEQKEQRELVSRYLEMERQQRISEEEQLAERDNQNADSGNVVPENEEEKEAYQKGYDSAKNLTWQAGETLDILPDKELKSPVAYIYFYMYGYSRYCIEGKLDCNAEKDVFNRVWDRMLVSEKFRKKESTVERYGIILQSADSGSMKFYYYDIKQDKVLEESEGYPWFFAGKYKSEKEINDLVRYINSHENYIFKITGFRAEDDCNYFTDGTCLEDIEIKTIEAVKKLKEPYNNPKPSIYTDPYTVG